jgi:hypothetical protein
MMKSLMSVKSVSMLVAATSLHVACVPTLVVIDRTTLIEEESAGDWPDLDNAAQQKSVDFRPVVLPPGAVEKRRERAYQVMDGDYSLKPQKEPQQNQKR